jgi:hypothetical protein
MLFRQFVFHHNAFLSDFYQGEAMSTPILHRRARPTARPATTLPVAPNTEPLPGLTEETFQSWLQQNHRERDQLALEMDALSTETDALIAAFFKG